MAITAEVFRDLDGFTKVRDELDRSVFSGFGDELRKAIGITHAASRFAVSGMTDTALRTASAPMLQTFRDLYSHELNGFGRAVEHALTIKGIDFDALVPDAHVRVLHAALERLYEFDVDDLPPEPVVVTEPAEVDERNGLETLRIALAFVLLHVVTAFLTDRQALLDSLSAIPGDIDTVIRVLADALAAVNDAIRDL